MDTLALTIHFWLNGTIEGANKGVLQMNENAKKVKSWLAKDGAGWKVGSHMHRGMFIISRPMPGGMLGPLSREWRVAKFERTESDGRRIVILDGSAPLLNAAKAMMQRRLVEQGISAESEPTASLTGTLTFPINALDP